jgi:hypothetical protein
MVYTYDEIGRYIVEDEQKGEQRAEYGKAVLKEVMRLANEGQRIEKSADLLKNPFILEFLGLEEKSVYTEPVFETRILSNLQKFLLEMGKVFCLKPDKNALLSTKTVFMLIWCCITVCCNVMFL